MKKGLGVCDNGVGTHGERGDSWEAYQGDLCSLLEQVGLQQQQVAHRAGWAPATISRWLHKPVVAVAGARGRAEADGRARQPRW